MPEFYFNKFPVISYANSTCIDITKRVVAETSLRNAHMQYMRYTLKNETRADVVASNYYDDPYYEWLLYLTNGVIDPYYGWNLGMSDFNAFIEKKYGSIENALKKVKYYQNNWVNDDTEITVSTYNNSLPFNLKKYYTPEYDNNANILYYKRSQEDTVFNTNQLINMNISIISGNGFVSSETVDIFHINTVVGSGEIEFANSSVIKIKNISGNTSATNKIRGDVSNTLATITTRSIDFINIPEDEAVYYSPVYYYDYEQELNEKNKNIKLINASYAIQTAENLRKLMKQ